MKALLRKDFYVMLTQLRGLLLVMLVFSVIPGGTFIPFTFLYTAVLSTASLIALDEQSRWDDLALMLPYSRRQLVASKYVTGWLGIVAALVATVAIQYIWAATGVAALGEGFFTAICLYIAIALVLQAVTVTVIFRFGYVWGRIMIVIAVAAIGGVVGAAAANGSTLSTAATALNRPHPVTYPLLAAALSVATIPISEHGYKVRCEK